MNGWFNPDNWLDLASQVLLVIGGLSIAVIPSWLATRRNHDAIKAVDAKAEAIVGQVVNGHAGKPALRVDIDVIREELSGIRDEMRGGFAALRGDITEERLARRTGDESIRAEIKRHHPPS